ncbi:surface lipoprotein assembly modifier [Alkalilimnicola ehrlichii]|uniref:DUF560 domain-containing protein n=1 Tax=Alkalilimnicola ehrlichii TaxID=351052 RepID=A0A3E0X102_9GAMM|nr:surface lipoprotein assembly modifier [Alkalilimnicola ehrlichii]RFA39329.1 hypothetical protein CAL65_00460 [Alkalilimnicola ehrlichii]
MTIAIPLRRLLVVALCVYSLAVAADPDTPLRLEQRLEHSAADQERELLREALDADGEHPQLLIDGRHYRVENTLDDLGRALYLSVRAQQWSAVRHFLAAYRSLSGHDPMLVHYAQGGLARAEGRLVEAEREYEALLAIQPEFLPGRLELARVLFENHKDREAADRFRDIRASLDPADRRVDGLRRSVELFLEALERRRRWQGSLAVGGVWDDNLNRSSEDRTCLAADAAGNCIIERRIPEAITAHGLDFEMAANRRLPLRGQHGLYLRSLLFGAVYKKQTPYNEMTSITHAGYHYRTARGHYAVAPLFEIHRLGNQTQHGAWGAHAEWQRHLSPNSSLRVEGHHKTLRYRPDLYAHHDGSQRAVYATLWHARPSGWMLLGGVDQLERSTEYRADSYRQYGARLGVIRQFDAVSKPACSPLFANGNIRPTTLCSNSGAETRNKHTP